MSSNRPPERRIPLNAVVVPSLETLLSDTLVVLGSELTHLRSKTKSGAKLDGAETKQFQLYVDSLVKIAREARETSKKADEDLSKISDDDLIELVNKILNDRKQKESEGTPP